MAIYAERNLRDLMNGAVDPENDQIQVRRIDDVIVGSWPHAVALTIGTAQVYQDGQVEFDDGGDSGSHPATGSRVAAGSFTFTLWDGANESPAYPCDINIMAPADWSATSLNFDTSATKLDFD